jgi:hypothetical protein
MGVNDFWDRKHWPKGWVVATVVPEDDFEEVWEIFATPKKADGSVRLPYFQPWIKGNVGLVRPGILKLELKDIEIEEAEDSS